MSDPKLPDAVKNAGDRADALVAEATGQKSGEATPEKKPAEAPEPQKKPTESAPAPSPDTWEHKYKVAQGMLEKQGKQLSELERANPVLIGQIQDLRAQLLQLQQESKPPKEPEVPLTQIDGIRKVLSEEEIDALDADGVPETALPLIVKLVQAVAKSVSGTQIADVRSSVDNLQQAQAQTLEDRFNEGMDALCSNWKAMDVDPGFIAWLNGTVAPGTDQTYKQLLNYHNNRFNYRKVAEIFNLYKDFAKAKADEPAPPDPLAGDVEPGGRTVPSGNPPSAESERIWKSSEIKKFYNDKALGRIPEKEANAMERDIDQARIDGRIQLDIVM